MGRSETVDDGVFLMYCLSVTGKFFYSNFDVYLAPRIYYAVNLSPLDSETSL